MDDRIKVIVDTTISNKVNNKIIELDSSVIEGKVSISIQKIFGQDVFYLFPKIKEECIAEYCEHKLFEDIMDQIVSDCSVYNNFCKPNEDMSKLVSMDIYDAAKVINKMGEKGFLSKRIYDNIAQNYFISITNHYVKIDKEVLPYNGTHGMSIFFNDNSYIEIYLPVFPKHHIFNFNKRKEIVSHILRNIRLEIRKMIVRYR